MSVVVGVGTDLMEIGRIERSIERYGERFLRRVFTEGEIAYCLARRRSAQSFAARFSAKEAGAKALGTGIKLFGNGNSGGLRHLELEVTRLPGRRPELVLHGRAQAIADGLGVKRLSLSLSHSREMALAMVVAEDSRE
jgi:holo-[acyl-carrier protein] synthase